MATTLQDSLRNLIAKGKTQQALDALADNLKGTDEGDTIILLQARWNRNKNANNMGVLSSGEYQMENNRITYALLSVIGELDDDSTGKEAVVEKVQQVIYNIQVQGTGHIINTGSGSATINNDNSNAISATDKDPSVQKKKTILFVAANPSGKNDASSGRELQTINDALNSGTLRDNFELKNNFASNVPSFLKLLKGVKPSVVHLSMHGGNNTGVLFEDEFGKADYVTVEDLVSFFSLVNKKERVVECVVLSACNSEDHAKGLKDWVAHSVGMKGPIPVSAAIEYTSGFYSSLFEDEDYDSAHKTAKILLKRYASKIEYTGTIAIPDIPQLFTHP